MKAGWELRRLGDLCAFDKTQGIHTNLPYVGLEHIESGTSQFLGSIEPTDVKSSTFKFNNSHVLYGRLRPYLNKVLLPDFEGHCSTEIFPIQIKPGLLREYLCHWLMSESVVESINATCTGARMPRADMNEVLNFNIPVPSEQRQHRIVTLLDEAFADIATAKANAEKNLQNARDFFYGQLQAIFESGSNSWSSSTLGQTYDVRDGTHDSPKYQAEGYPLITSKNLKREGLSFDDVKLISQLDYTKINERSAVHQGDVLLAMIGTIGNPTVVEIEPNFAIKNVALLKVPKTQSSYFLRYYLSAPSVIAKMQAEAKGTTQKFVGLGYLRAFPISIPTLAEQQKIVEKLDELRTESERLESIYRQKLTALDDLKKSLLHQAFNGQL